MSGNPDAYAYAYAYAHAHSDTGTDCCTGASSAYGSRQQFQMLVE